MLEIIIGIFGSVFIVWAGWISVNVIEILKEVGIIKYKIEDKRSNNEKPSL